MGILVTIIHVLVCFFLIFVVLLQQGKGAGIGAAFGGSSQTVFGDRKQGTLIGKLTAGTAIVFMITSFALALMSTRSGSVVEDKAVEKPAVSDKAEAGSETDSKPAENNEAVPVEEKPSEEAPANTDEKKSEKPEADIKKEATPVKVNAKPAVTVPVNVKPAATKAPTVNVNIPAAGKSVQPKAKTTGE